MACIALARCSEALPTSEGASVTPTPLVTQDALRVEGRQLTTQDGRVRHLQGFSTPGLEWNPTGENTHQSFEVAIRDWNVNVIRLPVKSTYWFGEGCVYYPQHDGGAAYRKLVDELIDYARQHGCYVILDLQEFQAPTKKHAAFWTSAAARYANHPAVLFDILNEPHDIGWKEWRDGLADNTNSIGMQALINAVRATGARNVIVAAGIDWGYDLSGLTEGYTLTDSKGNGIIYSTHIYPWKSDWNTKILKAARDFPVLVGEVGCQDKPMPFETKIAHDPYTWAPEVLAFIQRNQLNWTAWSFHPEAGPSIIADWNYTPTPYWGQFVRDALKGKRFVSEQTW